MHETGARGTGRLPAPLPLLPLSAAFLPRLTSADLSRCSSQWSLPPPTLLLGEAPRARRKKSQEKYAKVCRLPSGKLPEGGFSPDWNKRKSISMRIKGGLERLLPLPPLPPHWLNHETQLGERKHRSPRSRQRQLLFPFFRRFHSSNEGREEGRRMNDSAACEPPPAPPGCFQI